MGKRNCFLGWVLLLIISSCAPKKPPRGAVLYNQYCASCHIAPKIEELPKAIWKDAVLPDMLSRMDLAEMYHAPDRVQEGFRPKIKLQDWIALENYIVSLAPETLELNKPVRADKLELFETQVLSLDNENGALITYLGFDETNSNLIFGDISGNLSSHNFQRNTSETFYTGTTPVTWYSQNGGMEIITEVGILDPSELAQGSLISKNDTGKAVLQEKLHRPIHTLLKDLDANGTDEMVVSEFGNASGSLSLLALNQYEVYEKTILLNQPGCIKTVAKDMNADGKLDLITMTSQGNESITILYQNEALKFQAKKVIEFSPVYGSSWFELIDYNGDGLDDIITVNGDNADKSYVHKPYHGMRIFLNRGPLGFEQVYFYPLNGATRVLARDFDQDDDLDFALISTFPDYDNSPDSSFVYLENKNSKKYEFASKTLDDPGAGRWFLMDAMDIDDDGDEDLLLSSFTYVFTPVPQKLADRWSKENNDVLVLKNTLK